MSLLSTATLVPAWASWAASAAVPAAVAPERLVSTTRWAPRVLSQRLMCPPTPPVPPVMSTVPRGVQPAPFFLARPARTRRRAWIPLSRSATWSSPVVPARTAARLPIEEVCRSTSPPQRVGNSRAATRPSAQVRACTGLLAGSPATVLTAPVVSTHRGACTPASPRAWIRLVVAARPVGTIGAVASGASSSASSETTPARSCPAAAIWVRSTSRDTSPGATSQISSAAPAWASARATCTGTAPDSSAASRPAASTEPAGATSSQVPDSGVRDAVAGVATGVQVIR
ncbi:hypothetical protein Kisp01_36010 [Kineosporia sp. NBRC 101677]|nr:hypothetical protein Kisp01_36010 [Kineosporia sp. NBRC 101677]